MILASHSDFASLTICYKIPGRSMCFYSIVLSEIIEPINGFSTIVKSPGSILLYEAALSRHYSIAKIKTNRADFISNLLWC